MRKAWRKIARVLLLMVISVMIGGGVYLWNAKTLGGNSMPMPFGVGASVVLSGSMEPTLRVNDLVFIRTADTYRVGDVVVFQSGRMPVIHRLVALEGDMALTQGDANNVPDTPIPVGDIRGKLALRIPYGGIPVRALQSLPGTLAVVALAAWLLIRSRQNEKAEAAAEADALRAEILKMKAELLQADGPRQDPGPQAQGTEAPREA